MKINKITKIFISITIFMVMIILLISAIKKEMNSSSDIKPKMVTIKKEKVIDKKEPDEIKPQNGDVIEAKKPEIVEENKSTKIIKRTHANGMYEIKSWYDGKFVIRSLIITKNKPFEGNVEYIRSDVMYDNGTIMPDFIYGKQIEIIDITNKKKLAMNEFKKAKAWLINEIEKRKEQQ